MFLHLVFVLASYKKIQRSIRLDLFYSPLGGTKKYHNIITWEIHKILVSRYQIFVPLICTCIIV
jgi:hypothetical protein